MSQLLGDTLLGGARVAILGAGPAGCLFAIALLDGARARRRPVHVTLYDGGATLGRTREPVLIDASALSRLASAGIPLPAAACLPVDGVRGLFGEVQAEAPGTMFVAPRGDYSEGDLGAYLRATAISRGARLLPRAADGLLRTPEGPWVIRAAGAAARADVVVLAWGAGAPQAVALDGHVPPPVWRSCTAILEADAATRAALGPAAVAIPGHDGLPDLWLLPDARGAQVVALGPDVTASDLTEALLAAVTTGKVPGRFSLRAPRRRIVPAGASRPTIPAIGDALGGAPGVPGLGAAVAQAQTFAAALLDGGEVALRAAYHEETRALSRLARRRRRLRRRWARLPEPVLARALAREAATPSSSRPVERALAASVDPRGSSRDGEPVEEAPRQAFGRGARTTKPNKVAAFHAKRASVKRPGPRPGRFVDMPGAVRILFALLVATALVLIGALRRRRPPTSAPAVGPVFVIDDDPEQSSLVCSFLDGRGVPCKAFEDGLSATASALSERPAAILLDVALPWLDGPGICRVLKRSRHTRDVPVILATALPRSMARREGVQAGATDVLIKPLDLEGLVKRLEPYLPPPRREAPEGLDTPRANTR